MGRVVTRGCEWMWAPAKGAESKRRMEGDQKSVVTWDANIRTRERMCGNTDSVRAPQSHRGQWGGDGTQLGTQKGGGRER